MPNVFISYRRTDSAAYAGRIYDRLVAKFGRKSIFKDVDSIPPGVNFPDYILEALHKCSAALVVIGPSWLDERSAEGQRRLDDPADFVRIEVETALELGLTVIPVLVEGTSMPPAASLPPLLQPLSSINAVAVRDDPDFARDMERVVAALERAPAPRPAPTVRTAAGSASEPRTRPAPKPGDTPRLRSRVIAAAVTVLVVAMLGILTTHGLVWSQANTSAQKTAQADTAFAQHDGQTAAIVRATLAPTQTAAAATAAARTVRFPYNTPKPGPGCDPKNAEWQQLQTFDPPNKSIDCSLPDRVRLLAIKQACDTTACYNNGFMWSTSEYTQFPPPPVKLSVQVSNLTGSYSTLDFRVTNDASAQITYSLQLCSCGVWTASRDDSSTPGATSAQLAQAYNFDPSGTTTLTFTLTTTGVTYSVNDDSHPTRSETAPFQLGSVSFDLIGQSTDASVELLNFSITPLT